MKGWLEMKIEITNLERIIMIAPKAVLSALAFLGIVELFVSFFIGMAILIITAALFYACLIRIPFRPPYVGVVVVLGRRIPMMKKEGWHLVFPFFKIYTVTMVKVEKINLDFVFSDIRCKAREEEEEREGAVPKAGGEVLINISLTYFADYKSERAPYSLISFINSGDHEGVQRIIKDLIEEDIREMVHDYDWEQVTFSTGDIKKSLVRKLTGEELTEEKEEELNKNGLPDVADLGVLITRFNVGRVKEQGELAKAAETFAKEQQERRGQQIEADFTHGVTEKFTEIGLPPGEAADAAQLITGKAQKYITTYRGVETLGQAAGVIAGKIMGGTEKKEQQTKE